MKKYHFIGIGGIGMSGLARLALTKQHVVSGSDLAPGYMTDFLTGEGAKIFIGHSAAHVEPGTTVIYTTGIKNDNPEFLAAEALQCPLMHRSELLCSLTENYQALAVTGTHGKTTTASLLTWALETCGKSPSYAIGGIIPQLSSNAAYGEGNYFVMEACESDGTFLKYAPYGAIVTNIDFDHMDFYHTEEALIDAFKCFTEKTAREEHLFWCGDDPHLQSLHLKGISYGFGPHCQLRASSFKQKGWMISFDAHWKGKAYANIEVALTGKHNALNALAVFGLAISLGLEEEDVREALRSFQGVGRRCERKGEMHGILFLDDYAHHPAELKAVLSAVRQAVDGRRLIAVYQPHRYTRAKDCQGKYGEVFADADALFITEIYAAGESPIENVSHEHIISEIQDQMKGRCEPLLRAQAASVLRNYLRPHDVLITLGAGDITKLSGEVMEKLALKAPKKIRLGLVFGGASVEHEISLISSANICAALNKKYYEIEQFGITREGKWVHGEKVREVLKRPETRTGQDAFSSETFCQLSQCEILFPVLHGPYGEDGTIQGFFDMLSKAYVGCDHRSSAICMDKMFTKSLCKEAGLAVLPYVSFSRSEWDADPEPILALIGKTLAYPVFVKPVHLGSSIGIYKVPESAALPQAVKEAFRYDTRLIVENGLDNIREIEFAVVGNEDPIVFPPGEVLADGHIHDYDSKYGLNSAKPAAPFHTKAKLSDAKILEGICLAKAAYRAAGCSGMARVDTFLDKQGNFWFNEINPIPGFTQYSLYPLICESNGLPLCELLDKLIVMGLQRRRQLDRLEV